MRLEFESGEIIESPTDADLSRVEGEEFAILSRDSDTYIQCAARHDSPLEYVLEYQDGSIEQHFSADDGPITLDRLVGAFRKYLNGDETWRDDFRWERLNLS